MDDLTATQRDALAELEKRWQFRMRRRCEPLLGMWWRVTDPPMNFAATLPARLLGRGR